MSRGDDLTVDTWSAESNLHVTQYMLKIITPSLQILGTAVLEGGSAWREDNVAQA